MSFQPTRRPTALALLALGATFAGAQYSTPIGTGAAKPKTLRATAVLEWTGSLQKPSASRLMPIAVWDGERYQPAGLYLARPDPLALETGTQYELERAGEPVGLFNVRAAAELNGEWIGVGRFQAEAAPPPPPKLKASKHLPVLSNGKPTGPDKSAGRESPSNADGRPTLHRKTDDSAPSSSGSAQAGTPASPQASPDKTSSSPSKPADTSSTSSSGDSDHPTLHRRADSSDTSSTSSGSPAATTGAPPASGSGTASGTGSSTSSSTTSDPDGPTLHRRSDTASTKSPDVDPDRPTLHKHDDSASDVDPDRPTLHRARSGADASAAIDPDRPRLRYGGSAETSQSALPTRLVGVPPTMQQIVAVSDSTTGDPRPYQFQWASPDDAAQMKAALAVLAAQAIAKPNPTTAKPSAQFGPASHTAAARKTHPTKSAAPAVGPALVDEHFTAYELSFSGGATLVYSAHTADEGPKRVYVTLIAQPDFSGKPQVLLQQVARGDRLDEVPAMQLVDAVDTDNDQRAELIFQLTGAAQAPAAPAEPSQAAKDLAANTAADQATQFARDAAASAERAFAIYRVANGKALQVFNTGPLP
jgi:hypothetical protein